MRKHIIWSFNKEELETALAESKSYSELFNKLNLKLSKSLVKMLQYRIKKENLIKPNFKRKKNEYKFPIERGLDEILVDNSTYFSSVNLKNKLIKYNILKYECKECGLSEWRGKDISLQLHHINGKSNDNRLENLMLLCPNCHSQTDTYAGKKKKLPKKKKHMLFCQKCGVDVNNRLFCDDCNKEISYKRRKAIRPSYNELMLSINKFGYSATGRKYGVSDNAIRKWIKFYVKSKE